MKLVLISDTHNQMNKVNLPDGDLLIHAGDATNRGTIQEIHEFNKHLGEIKDKYKLGILFVPGNHDWLFQTNPIIAKQVMTNATVLIDETIKIEGFKMHFSPHQPAFCGWAFNLPRGSKLKEKWALIPDNADVVITHGPAQGILDLCPDGTRVGCKDLLERLLVVKPKLHVAGHIHLSHGIQLFNGITFVNAAICDEKYMTTNKPIVIELEGK